MLAAGNERHLVEVKWTENPSARDSQALRAVGKILEGGKAFDIRTSIVCRTPHLSLLDDGIRVVDVEELCR